MAPKHEVSTPKQTKTTTLSQTTPRTSDKSKAKEFSNIPKGKGLLYKMNGDVVPVDGPFSNLRHIYELIQCQCVQMVPCTVGDMGTNGALLLLDEEGMFNNTVNEYATDALGEQVYGGFLHGNILVIHASDFIN